MSIQSMTGFGKGKIEGDNFDLSVEIKTVNHRFKDMRFKMGSIFNSQEIILKKKLEKQFSRGSFDIFVNYKKNQKKQEELELDFNKITKFVESIKKISDASGVEVTVSPTEFMRNDFYKEDLAKEDELLTMLEPAFQEAIESLEISRNEEGGKLIEKLKEHQAEYTKHYEQITGLKETYQEKVKDKLKKRFEKDGAELNIDEPRFLQEVIYYLEKLDVDEEINRITIHLEKLTNILDSEGEVGRQIDFLIQELNRETNTIGSKSGDSSISENVVQMKVQLEKIREQALNLQ
jgi:uncharacterized protein (TIGR00255 family)